MYQVQSLTDSSLRGEIVVAEHLMTMFNNSTNTGPMNVALSWYPDIPKPTEPIYFKIQFLDKQTGKIHQHIDYTFSVLDSNGIEAVRNNGLIHSGEGKEFTAATFQSKGEFSPVITVRGIDFVPLAPDEVKFTMAIGPEFPMPIVSAIAAVAIGIAVVHDKRIL